MRRPNRYCLTRKQIKLSWNPQNCFNVLQFEPPNERNLNLFQLEWKSRINCRRFFNGDVREKVFIKEYNNCRRDFKATICKMERRVDNTLFRCMFAPSVFEARRMTTAGMVLVNGQRPERPSAFLADGDVIQIHPNHVLRVQNFLNHPLIRLWSFIPSYLEVNYPTLSAVFLRQPNFKEIPHPFSEVMIDNAAAYYSKRG